MSKLQIGIGLGAGQQFLEIEDAYTDHPTVSVVDGNADQRVTLDYPKGLLQVLRECYEEGRLK